MSTENTYIAQPIDTTILSTLNVNQSGAVVSAETWTTLWQLVFDKINRVDAYCASISEVVVDWRTATTTLTNLCAELTVRLDALKNGLVHIGATAPTNPDIKLWAQPRGTIPATYVEQAASSASAAAISASSASTSASNAASSASSASTSASNAASSASTATTKANEASTSASNASASATAASDSAGYASSASTAASGYASSAHQHATDASASSTAAGISASTAATKASEAAASASTASAAQSAVAASATTATNAATTATTQAGIATTKATEAAASAAEAASMLSTKQDKFASVISDPDAGNLLTLTRATQIIGENKLKVQTPVALSDVANKSYVDSSISTEATARQSADNLKVNKSEYDILKKRFENLNMAAKGIVYNDSVNNTSAYIKTIPVGSQKYATLDKLGGKTVVFNQLKQLNDPSALVLKLYGQGISDVSISDANKTITATLDNATSAARLSRTYYGSFTPGHKVLITAYVSNYQIADNTIEGVSTYTTWNTTKSVGISKSNIQHQEVKGVGWSYALFTIPTTWDATDMVQFYVDTSGQASYAHTTADTFTFTYNVFDLTKIFGAGNEPTFAQFKAIFPNAHYDYDPGSLLSGKVNNVVSKSKNLIPFPYTATTKTENGITYTVNSDRSITVNGTSTAAVFFKLGDIPLNVGSYMISGGATNISIYYNGTYDTGSGATFTLTTNTTVPLMMFVPSGRTVNNVTVYPQLEIGSTKTAYSPYKTPIQTSVPASVLALTGYGWSAGNVYNEVDYVNRKYIQRVGSVNLGSLDWIYQDAATRFVAIDISTLGIKGISANAVGNILCSEYAATTMYNTTEVSYDKSIAVYIPSTPYICVKDTAYTDAATFKTAMSGVMLYYELATPIETNLSTIISEDNFIEVEAGGSLMFNQVDNTQLPVTSTETFIIKVADAT